MRERGSCYAVRGESPCLSIITYPAIFRHAQAHKHACLPGIHEVTEKATHNVLGCLWYRSHKSFCACGVQEGSPSHYYILFLPRHTCTHTHMSRIVVPFSMSQNYRYMVYKVFQKLNVQNCLQTPKVHSHSTRREGMF